MDHSAMEGISVRLASIDGLYFPGAIHQLEAPDLSQRRSALFELLSRDAAIFLQRYGSVLTADELRQFEKLRSDYEVSWHLDRLWTRRNPTAVDYRSRSATVKNRRRAYMDRLVRNGEYFSEDSMREREPYLHYEYLGKYQNPTGRGLTRPGERWSDTLMRCCDEAMLLKKIRDEQQRLGVDRREWVGGGGPEEEEEQEQQEEEEEEEEEEEDDEEEEETDAKDENGQNGIEDMGQEEGNKPSDPSKMTVEDGADANNSQVGTTSAVSDSCEQSLSAEEMQDRLEQFSSIMQQKFLSGEDTEHVNYSEIDNDERLDDHWFKEANYDAEEKYFEED